jgi:hypothetical protein
VDKKAKAAWDCPQRADKAAKDLKGKAVKECPPKVVKAVKVARLAKATTLRFSPCLPPIPARAIRENKGSPANKANQVKRGNQGKCRKVSRESQGNPDKCHRDNCPHLRQIFKLAIAPNKSAVQLAT